MVFDCSSEPIIAVFLVRRIQLNVAILLTLGDHSMSFESGCLSTCPNIERIGWLISLPIRSVIGKYIVMTLCDSMA